jgi:DNA invertase Pin-like site-specific DNA recombinase
MVFRVSTGRQGASGLGLETQQAAVDAFVRQNGGVIVGQHVEVESGKRSDRPELAKALEAASAGVEAAGRLRAFHKFGTLSFSVRIRTTKF